MLYSLIVAVLSMVGGAVPLRSRPNHARLQIYLSLAAGALLGAALFHLLPESAEQIHASFGVPTVLGIALIFLLQRYVAPHSHEPWDRLPACHDLPAGDDQAHGHKHDHADEHVLHQAPGKIGPIDHAPSPQRMLSSVVAIAALSVHSFFDGVAIGAATTGAGDTGGFLAVGVFLSVLIHKPLDGLSVSVLLVNAGARGRALWAVQAAYAALVPVGAAMFLLTKGAVADPMPLVGYTLAFSAGTFLAIALTDLLPELHFHSHDRNKLSAALLTGLLVMWVTSMIGHSDHEHAEPHVERWDAPAAWVQ
jgi:zinc and cadmium transporter